MDIKYWPADNPAADALLTSFLDRITPGWTISDLAPITGQVAQEALWPWGEAFRGLAARAGSPIGEIKVDRALEAMAAGATFPFETLGEDGEATLMARVLVALTGATYATLDDSVIMRLPPGLHPDDRANAIVLRLLYQAPLSIEGM